MLFLLEEGGLVWEVGMGDEGRSWLAGAGC